MRDPSLGCFATAQRALKVPNRSKEGTIWLMSLLDALEHVSDKSPSTSLDSPIMPTGGLTFLSQMKAILAGNEAVSNEAAGAAHVENFALKVFMSADNDDRNGNTGK
jgi:vacuolar protein sorting-associated protein VTA1